MPYIHTESAAYPLLLTDIRGRHPDLCWPASGATEDLLSALGYAVVHQSPKPQAAGVAVTEGQPEKVGGLWRQTWVEAPMTTDQLEDWGANLQRQVAAAVQQHLDATARAHGYESIATCVTYAEEPSVARFQREGRAARAWRSKVWETCYAALNQVLAGERPPLTPQEMVAELPPIAWPD